MNAQGISALVTSHDHHLGHRSSGLMLLLWLGLVIYGTIKFRTYILITIDRVRFSLQRFCRLAKGL